MRRSPTPAITPPSAQTLDRELTEFAPQGSRFEEHRRRPGRPLARGRPDPTLARNRRAAAEPGGELLGGGQETSRGRADALTAAGRERRPADLTIIAPGSASAAKPPPARAPARRSRRGAPTALQHHRDHAVAAVDGKLSATPNGKAKVQPRSRQESRSRRGVGAGGRPSRPCSDRAPRQLAPALFDESEEAAMVSPRSPRAGPGGMPPHERTQSEPLPLPRARAKEQRRRRAGEPRRCGERRQRHIRPARRPSSRQARKKGSATPARRRERDRRGHVEPRGMPARDQSSPSREPRARRRSGCPVGEPAPVPLRGAGPQALTTIVPPAPDTSTVRRRRHRRSPTRRARPAVSSPTGRAAPPRPPGECGEPTAGKVAVAARLDQLCEGLRGCRRVGPTARTRSSTSAVGCATHAQGEVREQTSARGACAAPGRWRPGRGAAWRRVPSRGDAVPLATRRPGRG